MGLELRCIIFFTCLFFSQKYNGLVFLRTRTATSRCDKWVLDLLLDRLSMHTSLSTISPGLKERNNVHAVYTRNMASTYVRLLGLLRRDKV